jgi:DNA-directed RNA polymerase alpha subunit
VRARNVLVQSSVRSWGQLADEGENQIREERNCGDRMIEEFEQSLKKRGLSFRL